MAELDGAQQASLHLAHNGGSTEAGHGAKFGDGICDGRQRLARVQRVAGHLEPFEHVTYHAQRGLSGQ